jgi:hypothetical protein
MPIREPVAVVERKETAMVGRMENSSRWATHIAFTDARRVTQKLSADLAAGADPRVIAEDRAAVAQSRGRLDVLV